MKRYFKHYADDIGFGHGMAYLEFEDEWATRQVQVYNDRWLASIEGLQEHDPDLGVGTGSGLVDQPLSVLELGPEHEISQAEFEAVWSEAIRRLK